jgi:hypothetical protein
MRDKQEQIELTIIDGQIKAAKDDPDFRLYLATAYTPQHLDIIVQDSTVLPTLHHAFLAGVEVGKIHMKTPRMKTPGVMRYKY